MSTDAFNSPITTVLKCSLVHVQFLYYSCAIPYILLIFSWNFLTTTPLFSFMVGPGEKMDKTIRLTVLSKRLYSLSQASSITTCDLLNSLEDRLCNDIYRNVVWHKLVTRLPRQININGKNTSFSLRVLYIKL